MLQVVENTGHISWLGVRDGIRTLVGHGRINSAPFNPKPVVDTRSKSESDHVRNLYTNFGHQIARGRPVRRLARLSYTQPPRVLNESDASLFIRTAREHVCTSTPCASIAITKTRCSCGVEPLHRAASAPRPATRRPFSGCPSMAENKCPPSWSALETHRSAFLYRSSAIRANTGCVGAILPILSEDRALRADADSSQ